MLGVATIGLTVSAPAHSAPRAPTAYNYVPATTWNHLTRGINADNIGMVTRYATYSSSDLIKLRQMGMNFVRIPIDVSCVLVGVPMDYKAGVSAVKDVDKCLAAVDNYLPKFQAAGFSVILSTFMGVNAFNLGVDQSKDILQRANIVLASRYAAKYPVSKLIFEPYSEPRYYASDWNAVVPDIVSAIRIFAPLNTIIVGPIGFNKPTNLPGLTVLADKNIIYAMHVYEPSPLTMQGAGAHVNLDYDYPKPVGSLDKTEWSTDRVNAYLQLGVDWAAANNVKIILEEFGATSSSHPPDRDAWITTVRTFAETHNMPWCFWSFDGRLFGLKPHPNGFDPVVVKLLTQP